MKEIIIYDSLSGNTEELAKEIKKEKPSAKLEKITTETVSQMMKYIILEHPS